MKESRIKVLKIAPGKHPETVTINNTLEDLQKAVSIGADYRGLIEVLNIEPNICIICNEEGKLIGLEPNRALGFDILCGVFYIAGSDKAGNFTSLKKADIERYSKRFWNPQIFSKAEVERLLKMCIFTDNGGRK